MLMLSVVTPALTGVVGALMTAAVLAGLSWVYRALKDQLNAGHAENTSTLAAILKQTEETNGMVKRHTQEIAFLRERTAGLESAVFHRAPITGADEVIT